MNWKMMKRFSNLLWYTRLIAILAAVLANYCWRTHIFPADWNRYMATTRLVIILMDDTINHTSIWQ